MTITIASAVISTSVSTTLNFTLSPTPRRLIAASDEHEHQRHDISAAASGGEVGRRSRSAGWPASRLDDVDALVMPEQTTVKATRNVTKWMPNALCV